VPKRSCRRSSPACGRFRIASAEPNCGASSIESSTLLWLRDRIGDDLLDAAVITTGEDAYRRADGIAVIPAALLGP